MRVDVVAEGLELPWEIDADRDRLLGTDALERAGAHLAARLTELRRGSRVCRA
jgi:hypothetical protein